MSKAKFYRVIADMSPEAQLKVMKAHADSSPAAFEVDTNHRTYRMTDPSFGSRVFTATIFERRMTDLPARLTPGGEDDLQLSEDDGLGDGTSFAYHAPAGLLLLQHNHRGPGAPAFRAFMRDRLGIAGIKTEPDPLPSQLERARNAKQIRRLEVSLKDPANLGDLAGKTAGLAGIINAATAVDGYRISVQISVERESNGLNKGNILRWFSRLLGAGDSVTTLKAGLRDNEDSETVLVDLLEMQRSIEFDPAYKNRRMNGVACQGVLRRNLLSIAK